MGGEKVRGRVEELSGRGGIGVLHPRVHGTRGSEGRTKAKQRHAGEALLSLRASTLASRQGLSKKQALSKRQGGDSEVDLHTSL